MESYVPLVKAIIISAMFSWGTSSVVITDQYILKENIINNLSTSKEEKSYQIYDLKNKAVYDIDSKMQYKTSRSDTMEFDMNGSPFIFDRSQLIRTSLKKENLDQYNCKKEVKEMVTTSSQDHNPPINYSDQSYFAKISWLDEVLNSEMKRSFAGFNRQEYSPYHYLIYEFIQYPNQEPKDQVLRIIEKSEVDTALIHTLLSLPLKD